MFLTAAETNKRTRKLSEKNNKGKVNYISTERPREDKPNSYKINKQKDEPAEIYAKTAQSKLNSVHISNRNTSRKYNLPTLT